MRIPVLAGPYQPIYLPQPTRFAGPDGPTLRAGEIYDDWTPNDHTLVRGPEGLWHLFGITGPESPVLHEAEWQGFHAVSPQSTLAGSGYPWQEQPQVLTPAERPGERREFWAPYVYAHQGTYFMYWGPEAMRYAVSDDLYHWEPQGAVFLQEGACRDPHVSCIDDVFHMVYVAGDTVWLRRSDDLIHWSDQPTALFRFPFRGCPESPVLIQRNEGYYLFTCIHDSRNTDYDNRTFVYWSDRMDDLGAHAPVTVLTAHAPEIVCEGDTWYITTAEWPRRGVCMTTLDWLPQGRGSRW